MICKYMQLKLEAISTSFFQPPQYFTFGINTQQAEKLVQLSYLTDLRLSLKSQQFKGCAEAIIACRV